MFTDLPYPIELTGDHAANNIDAFYDAAWWVLETQSGCGQAPVWPGLGGTTYAPNSETGALVFDIRIPAADPGRYVLCTQETPDEVVTRHPHVVLIAHASPSAHNP